MHIPSCSYQKYFQKCTNPEKISLAIVVVSILTTSPMIPRYCCFVFIQTPCSRKIAVFNAETWKGKSGALRCCRHIFTQLHRNSQLHWEQLPPSVSYVRTHFLSPTLRLTLLVSLSQINTHTRRARIAAQCSALGGVPILMAFPSTDNALCPTKEALNQTLGPCLALGSPADPRKAPCADPPQPARVPRGTSVWLVKRLHWSSHPECCLYSSVCVFVCVCGSIHVRPSSSVLGVSLSK